jgi:hypothetical protein
MRKTTLLSILILLALNVSAQSQTSVPDTSGPWIQLFNGKNLHGWIPKFAGYKSGVNYKNTFRVEDGLLKVSYDQYKHFDGQFGHLFYKKKFSSYILRVVYRFVGNQVPGGPVWGYRNNGIMIFCQSPQSMRLDQDYPVSVEVQLLGGNGKDKRPTANGCTPGTNIVIDGKLITQHCNPSTSPTFNGNQWVAVTVVVHSDSLIRNYVNGKLVFQFSQPQLDPNDPDGKRLLQKEPKLLKDGYIAIQAESAPTEFKEIEIKEIRN